MTLQGYQRRHLRALAHPLRPVVQMGRNGLGEGVVDEVAAALEHHELIKVRVAGERRERRSLVDELAARTGAEVVGVVGSVATMFRRHPDPERRQVSLPARPEGGR